MLPQTVIGQEVVEFDFLNNNLNLAIFTATGALYLTKILVTIADKNEATVTPDYTEGFVEASSLAEFSAVENGKLVKLNLNNAVITSGMVNGWGYYVQDATAGAHFYCTGLDFEVNDALSNGKTNYAPYVYQEDLTNVDYAKATITGILWSNTADTTFKLYPLSVTNESGTGITEVERGKVKVERCYNLQGVRLNQLQRGINIVNGRQVVMK